METEELIKLAQIASEITNPSALEAFKCTLAKFGIKDGEELPSLKREDGIYVIYQNHAVRYRKGMEITGIVKYIGLKIGCLSIAITLKDVYDEEIILTINEDKTSYNGYIDNYIDAISDWNGYKNTQHLKMIGLNPKIVLNEKEYIPAAGQLGFINLFIKSLNEALEAVGGEPLSGWYWNSSESSAANALYLSIGGGGLGTRPKVSAQNHVRAVSAFKL